MTVRLIIVALAWLWASAAAEPLKVDGLPLPVELSLPSNHDPAKSWPAVFFYHGMGGHPTTKMIREQTGAKDWIVVGMAYTQPGAFKYSPENLAKEIAVMHQVRDQLAKTKGLDPKRVYVSGFSMGGWVTSMFFQADRSLAGAAILGAGHMIEVEPKLGPLKAETPLFLGVGRKDGNYPFSLKAKLYYGRLGATVRMETWDGLGHEFPKEGSPGLKEWFALRKGGTPDAAAMEAEYAKIGKLAPRQEWRALLEFRERPYVNEPGQVWLEKIKTRIGELEVISEVAGESKAYKRHRQLLADEMAATTLPQLVKVQKGYEALVPEAGEGEEVDLIVTDLKRLTTLVENFEAQLAEKQAQQPKPEPVPLPKRDRQVPRNPMVR
ncbi:hypothetical protein [Luteolibacter sp. Populi]|uniref:hypothetical protein n=1 Tax=Luteolibacter sp. Populi TaxID=3230487 RepID=UPI00346552D0